MEEVEDVKEWKEVEGWGGELKTYWWYATGARGRLVPSLSGAPSRSSGNRKLQVFRNTSRGSSDSENRRNSDLTDNESEV